MRRLAVVLLLAAIVACGSDSTTEPQNGPLAGTYLLRTVNAKGLPTIAYPHPTSPITVAYGRVVLNADGSFADSTVYTYPSGGVQQSESDVYKGTYVQDGDHITFHIPGNPNTYSMAWTAGNALTFVTDELTFLYRK